MRSFALVTLMALCVGPVPAAQNQPSPPAPLAGAKPASAKGKVPAAPAAPALPAGGGPARALPRAANAGGATKSAGLYLRASCTIEPGPLAPPVGGQTYEVGKCQIKPAPSLPLPRPALDPAEFDSCLKVPDRAILGSGLPAFSAAAVQAQIKTLLGTTSPEFQLLSTGNSLYIYSADDPLTPSERRRLTSLVETIGGVAVANSGYVFELDVPHASALGSSAVASLQAIAPSGITVATTGTASLRVTVDGTVGCYTLKAFLGDFERFANHTHSDTPVASIFFIDPAASGSALGATAIPYAVSGAAALGNLPLAAQTTSSGTGGGTGSGAGAGAGSGSGSGAGAGSGSGTGSGAGAGGSAPATAASGSGATPVASSAGGTSSGASGSSSGQTITITSATTTGSSPAPALAAGGTAPAGPVTTTTISTTQPLTPPASPSMTATPTAPAAPSSAPAFSVNGLDLLFTGGTPGDDAWITEKKRALALLDLPQPQVLVNAWMVQNSTTRGDQSGQLTTFLHQIVNSYNDTIQLSLYLGWSKLMQMSSDATFFDAPFYNYITLRTVANPPPVIPGTVITPSTTSGAPATSKPVSNAQTEQSVQRDEPDIAAIKAVLNPKHGICPEKQYCLGYTTLFRPAHPRLTDMLLTLLAANDPGAAAEAAINEIETGSFPTANRPSTSCGTGVETACKLPDETLQAIKKSLWLGRIQGWAPCSCQQRDEQTLWSRASSGLSEDTDQRLPLECFRDAMRLAGVHSADLTNPTKWTRVTFDDLSPPTVGQAPVAPTVGVARAALADFLFNYKMSQEFPHEFTPYDLTSSAQALDSALAPYIHAFNEDLQAYQNFMRAEFVAGVETLKLTRDKNSFFNDGIITVQTTSGDLASVSTGTQNYLNVSRAPSISQLLSSVTGTTGTSSSLTSGLLSNLSPNQAQVLVGALAAFQSTSLNVNRQLNLVVKPRSLLGAEASEIDVQFNADQAGAPQYWNPGPSGSSAGTADVSGVSQHDVTTHVRIDSIQLFDISSLTAIVSKGREKFPLLPPFVEIPYIGTLVGIPLPAAREYHSSSAVLSAVIVPTATDIAYSLRFTDDRILLPSDAGKSYTTASSWKVRKATSMNDFGPEPVREYHKMKLQCFATLGASPYPVGLDEDTPTNKLEPAQGCEGMTFDNVFQEDSTN